MKWKKQLCAAAAVLLALGIALAGVLLNQHFLVLSGGISRTEIQSPLGDWVRSHLQLVALIVFATLAAAILALYHYKKQPELRYFLLYLAVLFFWGTLVAFFPAGFQGLLQRFMRLFFAITILASALLSAALLALPLPAKWVVPASTAFLLLGQAGFPMLRFSVLTAGMCLCLCLLLSAYLRDHNRVPGVGPAAHSPLLCRVLPALPAAVRPGVRYPVCAGLHDLRLPPLCFAV